MKPNLYICHTAYQVLVDLLRAGRCACLKKQQTG